MCRCLQTVPEVAELQLGDGTIVRVAAGGITVRVVWVEVDGVGPVVSDRDREKGEESQLEDCGLKFCGDQGRRYNRLSAELVLR